MRFIQLLSLASAAFAQELPSTYPWSHATFSFLTPAQMIMELKWNMRAVKDAKLHKHYIQYPYHEILQ